MEQSPVTDASHLYHVTDASNLGSIVASGLAGSRAGGNYGELVRQGCVYLCQLPYAVMQASEEDGWGDTIIRVAVKHLKPNLFRGDEEDFRTWETREDWSAEGLVASVSDLDATERIREALACDAGTVAYEGDIPPKHLEACWLPERPEYTEMGCLRKALADNFGHVVPAPEVDFPPPATHKHWLEPMPDLVEVRRHLLALDDPEVWKLWKLYRTLRPRSPNFQAD